MSRVRTLDSVVRWVYTKPPAIAIAAAAVIASLVRGDLYPLLAGIAAEILLLLYELRDPRVIRQALRERRKRELAERVDAIEDEIDLLDTESRLRMRNILDLYKQLHDEAEDPEVQEFTASTLLASTSQVAVLTDKALRLAKKRRELQRYLNRTTEEDLQAYINELNKRIENGSDPVERAQHEQTLRLKMRELEDYRAIAATARRIDGQLENIECAFAGLRARLVRLKAADITQWSAAGEVLKGELEALSTSVETLEQSVNEALSI